MNYPSVKAIETGLSISHEKAVEIRGILTGKIARENYPSVESLRKQSFYPQKHHYEKLLAISDITECHGVEYLNEPELQCAYVNTGDSYTNTVIRVFYNRKLSSGYKIASWGDLAERYLMS